VHESRFAGLGVALITVVFLVMLPFMIAIGFFVFATIQAMVKGPSFSSETLNIPVFLIVLVGTVALFAVLMAGVVALVGRSFTPRKRRDREPGFGAETEL
jgi:hypothetical protein